MAEIYGTAFIETGNDKIKTLIDALITSMAEGYDPAIAYAYQSHNRAYILLNAVTIDFENAEQMLECAGSVSAATEYLLTYSIRVHTDYNGGVMDGQKNARLLNSIMNKFKANFYLGDDYKFWGFHEMEPRMTFDESPTVGGQVMITLKTGVRYTQE